MLSFPPCLKMQDQVDFFTVFNGAYAEQMFDINYTYASNFNKCLLFRASCPRVMEDTFYFNRIVSNKAVAL